MKNECECKFTYFVSDENDGWYSVVCKASTGEKVDCIRNISRDEKTTVDFCEFLNRNKISAVHFYDVFDDFFA